MRPLKRLFDLVFAALGLVLCSPLFATVALLIKLRDRGPVFYKQQRVGWHGKPFRMWKFRTMVVNADKLGKSLTIGRDPRITPVGHFLRQTKLDELPQLINVLRGEMSFVGPRPEVEEYVRLYTPEQAQVLDLRPGITDPASIKYRNESEILATHADPEQAYISEIMPEKIRLNLEYGARANVLTDLLVIVRTLARLAG